MVKGFLVKEGGVVILMLQYVDDTLLLLDDGMKGLNNIRAMMLWFEETTVLQVNTSKTLLYKVNEPSCWEELLESWKCKVGKLPDMYLGMPLGSNFKSKLAWHGLIDKL